MLAFPTRSSTNSVGNGVCLPLFGRTALTISELITPDARRRVGIFMFSYLVIAIGGALGSLEVENEVWLKIYEINVLSHVYLARAVFPSMIAHGAGAFMITASAAGLLTHPLAAPYAATKHAAVALAENLAIEFAEKGIYVSCLCPQGVKTQLIARQYRLAEFRLVDAP